MEEEEEEEGGQEKGEGKKLRQEVLGVACLCGGGGRGQHPEPQH